MNIFFPLSRSVTTWVISMINMFFLTLNLESPTDPGPQDLGGYSGLRMYMTLKSTYCGVAGNRFQTCMTSAAKKTKINIELESTLLLFLDKETRHRPQLKFNSRCIAFQIASYLKNVRT